ncbi:unnamed protein product [Brassicogethes aeneus]|uniref:UBA domain-containing protein n=1 Tax=Brassicogethes aeneus TaxID=1431903 RepID=A0A9P0FMM1_BRAAE|nr:unnamed protein product [Brassicogethes aeneus]
MMRALTSSEPKSTFPTYQVPLEQESAMRGAASSSRAMKAAAAAMIETLPPPPPPPPDQLTASTEINSVSAKINPPPTTYPVVQLILAGGGARGGRKGRADLPACERPAAKHADATAPANGGGRAGAQSVIPNGSSCGGGAPEAGGGGGNSNCKIMQSVTEICLLNYSTVTVPNRQRNDRLESVAHNNSDKLDSKFGALSLGRDIPNQKSDDLLEENKNKQKNNDLCNNNNKDDDDDDDDNLNKTTIANNNNSNTTPKNITTIEDEDARAATPLRLRGGGESSLSTGTSNWGSPPNQQASNNNANKVNANGQQPPAAQSNSGGGSQSGGWCPPGGGKPPVGGGAPANGPGPVGVATAGGAVPPVGGAPGAVNNNVGAGLAPTATTTKQQLEQLNNMREAIFSQDGWGGQHVNQDTNWDIPGSPEPPMKMDGTGPSPWKPTVNNGTELWEANLRNGGQPPPQPQQKTPWGHTPSTNIGGTWGEDDDADSSNVWTGVPSGQQQQQWGGGGNANNGAMWGGGNNVPKKDAGGNGGGGAGDWSGGVGGSNAVNQSGGGWGDPRGGGGVGPDPRGPGVADMRGAVPGGASDGPGDGPMRGGGGPGGGPVEAAQQMRMMDPMREQMRQLAAGGDMRGDPRGITGRINAGGAEAFWGQSGGHPGAPHQMHHQNKMPVVGPGGNGSGGWEEPSPPTQRRNMPNYDDGTSLWGNPQQGGKAGSHWKDMPTGAGGMVRGGNGSGGGGPPGMAQSRGNGGGGNIKPDGVPVWGGGHGGGGGNGRNGGSWDEVGPGACRGGGNWDDGPWPKQKMGPPLWDSDPDWGHNKGPKPQLSKDMIWQSKQFRMLAEAGYKKEEVENALRMRDMNVEEALELLSSPMRGGDGWRSRHDDHYDHLGNQFGGGGNQRFPGGPGGGQMGFPPSNAGPNLLNSMNGSSNANNLINSMSPAGVQKLLNQGGGGGGSQGFGGSSAASGRSMQPQAQPSTQQLRMLVQQIQMAVQAGYLNHQILNQPLAPQTLLLLNQLLQQIKTLQQLAQQHTLAQNQVMNGSKPTNNNYLQCSVLITKTKQQITNLQNQIAAQQAMYVKQQHQPIGGPDLFKAAAPMHDSLNAMQSNFADISLKEAHLWGGGGRDDRSMSLTGGDDFLQNQQQQQQQSRLNQWINKDKEDGNEFSRAPGSSSKPLATSPNMNPLLPNSDGPWSSGRSGDTGWPDSGGDSSNDVKDAQWSTPAQPSLTDLVPEFEPGKPWKGNQIKSIEDDPSITPGSVVRSPLSMTTIKDSEMFGMNPSKSPPADSIQGSLALGSSTWSYINPSPSTSSAFTSPQSKLAGVKGGLGDLNPSTTVASELWGAPPKSRGPPPGLSAKNSCLSNGWSTGGGGGGAMQYGGGPRSSGSWGGGGGSSPWLLLKNLTAQIDGSTLRTLCMQHGPLQNFHLYLHQGFALAKYSTREEATKAQTALNNCVLGNTTIHAEKPVRLGRERPAAAGGVRPGRRRLPGRRLARRAGRRRRATTTTRPSPRAAWTRGAPAWAAAGRATPAPAACGRPPRSSPTSSAPPPAACSPSCPTTCSAASPCKRNTAPDTHTHTHARASSIRTKYSGDILASFKRFFYNINKSNIVHISATY